MVLLLVGKSHKSACHKINPVRSQITTPRGDGLFLLALEGTLIKVTKVI